MPAGAPQHKACRNEHHIVSFFELTVHTSVLSHAEDDMP
jgi:hypothetical protein